QGAAGDRRVKEGVRRQVRAGQRPVQEHGQLHARPRRRGQEVRVQGRGRRRDGGQQGQAGREEPDEAEEGRREVEGRPGVARRGLGRDRQEGPGDGQGLQRRRQGGQRGQVPERR